MRGVWQSALLLRVRRGCGGAACVACGVERGCGGCGVAVVVRREWRVPGSEAVAVAAWPCRCGLSLVCGGA